MLDVENRPGVDIGHHDMVACVEIGLHSPQHAAAILVFEDNMYPTSFSNQKIHFTVEKKRAFTNLTTA